MYASTGAEGEPTEPEGHALAGGVLLLRPARNPARVGVIKVDVRLQDVTQSALAREVVQRAEVAVESPVYMFQIRIRATAAGQVDRGLLTVKDGQNHPLFLRQRDEPVRLGAGVDKGLLDNHCGSTIVSL